MSAIHPIFLGETLVRDSVIHKTHPVTGTISTVTYRGTKDQIDDILAQANEEGIEASQSRFKGPYYECQCVFPYEFGTNPEPQIIWEISQEILNRSIFVLPKVTKEATDWATTLGAPVAEYQKEINDALREGRNLTIINTADYPIALEVLRELSAGTDSWEDSVVVLRRRQSIAPAFAPQTQISAARIVYTTSQLTTTFSVPSEISALLPSDPSETPDSYHKWSWKMRPGTRTYIGQRIEMVDEWIFACWSTFLYDVAS